MPQTEQCLLGVKNETNIKAMEKAFEDFRTEVRDDISKIFLCIDKITNHYSKKPSWSVCAIITFLSSLSVALIVWIVAQ